MDAAKTVIHGTMFVLEQAAAFAASPGKLGEKLQGAGFADVVAGGIAGAWEAEGPSVVAKLKSLPLGANDVLNTVDWNVRVQVARPDDAILATPVGQLTFVVTPGNSQVGGLLPAALMWGRSAGARTSPWKWSSPKCSSS